MSKNCNQGIYASPKPSTVDRAWPRSNRKFSSFNRGKRHVIIHMQTWHTRFMSPSGRHVDAPGLGFDSRGGSRHGERGDHHLHSMGLSLLSPLSLRQPCPDARLQLVLLVLPTTCATQEPGDCAWNLVWASSLAACCIFTIRMYWFGGRQKKNNPDKPIDVVGKSFF
jgi:hypothetical protein